MSSPQQQQQRPDSPLFPEAVVSATEAKEREDRRKRAVSNRQRAGHVLVHELYGLLGREGITALSEEFHRRIWADDEMPWFRDMFKNSASFDEAVRNQVLFFVQRFGGPSDYMDRAIKEGRLNVTAVHRQFHVTPKGLERWLHHMSEALDALDTPEEPALGPLETRSGVKKALMGWFHAFGSHHVNASDEGLEASDLAHKRPKGKATNLWGW